MNEIPELRNWTLVYDCSPYIAPEDRRIYLEGDIYGSIRPDGTNITTSRLLGKINEDCIKTKNNIYKLGDASPLYEGIFPNSRKRLFDTLPLI